MSRPKSIINVTMAAFLFCPFVLAATDDLARLDLAAQQAMAQWAKYSFFVTLAGLILSGGGLIALLASLRHTRAATQAAENAVKVAQETFAAESRAWVSLACTLSRPERGCTQDGRDGIYFNVQCVAKNHGVSPATSVSFHAEIALVNINTPSPEEILAKYCENIRARADHDAEAIFPDVSINTTHMVFVSLADIEADLATKDFKMIAPIVFGCLNYKSPYLPGVRQTRFQYHVVTLNEQGQAFVVNPTDPNWLEKPLVLSGPGKIIAD